MSLLPDLQVKKEATCKSRNSSFSFHLQVKAADSGPWQILYQAPPKCYI